MTSVKSKTSNLDMRYLYLSLSPRRTFYSCTLSVINRWADFCNIYSNNTCACYTKSRGFPQRCERDIWIALVFIALVFQTYDVRSANLWNPIPPNSLNVTRNLYIHFHFYFTLLAYCRRDLCDSIPDARRTPISNFYVKYYSELILYAREIHIAGI